jgi:hypothetical protein
VWQFVFIILLLAILGEVEASRITKPADQEVMDKENRLRASGTILRDDGRGKYGLSVGRNQQII